MLAEAVIRLENAGVSLSPGDKTALAQLASGDPVTMAAVISLIERAIQAGMMAGQIRTAGTRQTVWALLIPADIDREVQVIPVANSAAALSAAIGGGLLDDSTVGELPGGAGYVMYLVQDQNPHPDNARATTLAARLGQIERDVQHRICGDVLVAGVDPHTGDDINVPAEAIDALGECGAGIGADS